MPVPLAALADAQLPDFSQLTEVSAFALVVSVAAGIAALSRGSREEAETAVFYGLLLGGGLGLLAYLAQLVGVP